MHHYLTAEVSRSAVAHNLKTLRAQLPPGCRLCAVVKADCYGHSVAALWPTIAAGADALAVATVPEALELRTLGYAGELLVLLSLAARSGGGQLDALAEAVRHDVQVSLVDPGDVEPLAHLGERLGRQPAVHVKIDTGMGRSGAVQAEAVRLIQAARAAKPLRLAGVFTHFACADERDKAHAEGQFRLFTSLLEKAGPLPGVRRHCANSAAIADLPHTALDMVRPGIAVYGYQPSDEMHRRLPLRPALRLTGPIVQEKRLPAGATCGYGRAQRLTRESRLGIVPAGYADGIARSLTGRYAVGRGEALLPVVGRVSMDQIIIDLTDHPAVRAGQTVELISPDPEQPNSVENLARQCGSIPYEVTCRLGGRTTYKAVDEFSEE